MNLPRALLTLTVAAGLLLNVAEASGLGTLRATVTDSLGAAVQAKVVIRQDAAQRSDRTERLIVLDTDVGPLLASEIEGRLTIAVSAGFYDVCVMADGFAPQCEKLRIRDTEVVERQYRLSIDLRILEP